MSESHCVRIRRINELRFSEQDTCTYKDELAVHCISIPAFIGHLDFLKAHLKDDEILKSENYLNPKDTVRYIVDRGILRVLLGKYLGLPPVDIEFVLDNKLKPHIKQAEGKLHFNVSHSGEMVLIAIGREQLGVDVEVIDREYDYMQAMERVFSEEERKFILDSRDQAHSFYVLWTRKEALLKGIGKGIDDHLPDIPSLEGVHEARPGFDPGRHSWSVDTFIPAQGYAGSLAYSMGMAAEGIPVYQVSPEWIGKHG